jgi:endonuclease/exonuclease/phosphatase family metal-dependent hydrolase
MSEIEDLEAYSDYERRERSVYHRSADMRAKMAKAGANGRRKRQGRMSDRQADAIFARVQAELAARKAGT